MKRRAGVGDDPPEPPQYPIMTPQMPVVNAQPAELDSFFSKFWISEIRPSLPLKMIGKSISDSSSLSAPLILSLPLFGQGCLLPPVATCKSFESCHSQRLPEPAAQALVTLLAFSSRSYLQWAASLSNPVSLSTTF